MASADAEAGASVFKKCASCHTIDKGGANKVGPNLYGIVGRPVASHEGFSYTEAMKAHAEEIGGDWDFASLSNFLLAPKKVVPGTAMGFAGLKKDQDRANLLAWLNQQSDSPLPLPAPEVVPPPEGTAGKGDVQPQAESAGAAEGAGDVPGAMPATSTTESAPSSEAGKINVAPTAVEGTGEPLSSDDAGQSEPAASGETVEQPAAQDTGENAPANQTTGDSAPASQTTGDSAPASQTTGDASPAAETPEAEEPASQPAPADSTTETEAETSTTVIMVPVEEKKPDEQGD